MAASPPTSENFTQAISGGPTIAPRLRGISTSVSAASSPPGPPTPSSASSSSATRIAVKPGTVARPAINTTGGPANKMTMAAVLSPSPCNPHSITSKEWVIPPRPKPGRKPATDTPPTKRKAQNRAAQRAFRERRAARVGELEEELTETKEEQKKREEGLEARIHYLEAETEALRARCQLLQSTLEKERLDRMRQNIRATPIQTQDNALSGGMTGQTFSQQPQGAGRPVAPRPVAQPFSISNIISPPEEPDNSAHLTCGSCGPTDTCICASTAMAETTFGCGNCSDGSRCACAEAAVQAEVAGMSDLKRPMRASSPSSLFMESDEKRQRLNPEPSTYETDFTAVWAQKKRTVTEPNKTEETCSPSIATEPQPQDEPHMSVEEGCGFCSDGRYCPCAEAPTASTPVTSSLTSTSLTATAMPAQQQTHTPPPSDDDVVKPFQVTSTGAIKLPPFSRHQTGPSSRSTCPPSGPGTCAQCVADPMSGLICRSLAAKMERSREESCAGGAAAGGCGGASGTGACCKQAPQPTGRPALTLPCAEAITLVTGSRHFSRAAPEIGEWLPRLRAAPAEVPGRAPIEVEVASIMGVLQGFEVRFGK